MNEDIWLWSKDSDNHKHLYFGLTQGAYEIVGITQALSRAFGKERAIIGYPDIEILFPAFCELVEEVYNNPNVLVFNWFQIATSFYEMVHNKVFDWEWPTDKLPNGIGNYFASDYVKIFPLYDTSQKREELCSSGDVLGNRLTRSSSKEDEPLTILFGKQSKKILGQFSSSTMRLFYELTIGLASGHEFLAGCMESTETGYFVEEELFSSLVEGFATTYLYLYFQWFRLAIAVYNQIHEVSPVWKCRALGPLPLMNDAVEDLFTVEPIWLETRLNIPYDESIILPSNQQTSIDWYYNIPYPDQ